ncbi:MAG: helix-turn-helix transcriptional regulator [Pirellulales bacterium]|nr:helix-turn-helix transcriptional regulator [Pirellulales bacterium]
MFQEHSPADEPVFTENDVRQVIRLVARTAAMREPPAACIRAMMDGLCELVGAPYWTWLIARATPGEQRPVFIANLTNLPENIREDFYRSSTDPSAYEPNMPRLVQESRSSSLSHITRTRQQLLSDEEWYESLHYRQHRAPANLDHCMYSLCPLKLEGVPIVLSVGLHRTHDQQPFNERERRLAHLLLTEADWLRTALVPPDEGVTMQSLAPRERQTLMFLMDGHSSKQIATKMGISIHSVNDYLKTIHRHYGVSSRSELFSYFLTGQNQDALRD